VVNSLHVWSKSVQTGQDTARTRGQLTLSAVIVTDVGLCCCYKVRQRVGWVCCHLVWNL